MQFLGPPRSKAQLLSCLQKLSIKQFSSTATEILWLWELLRELCCPLTQSPRLYSDNIGATYLCANPVFHTCMKHLAINYHLVRDLVANKESS